MGWSSDPVGNVGIKCHHSVVRFDKHGARLIHCAHTYLWNTLRLVVGQQVVVELRTVKHACERFGRCGEGLGCKAVVAGPSWSPAVGFRGLFTGSIYRRLLRVTLVWQEVGLNCVLPSSRLGCGEDTETGQLGRLMQDQLLLGCNLSCTFRCRFWQFNRGQRGGHLGNRFIFFLHWTWLLHRLWPVPEGQNNQTQLKLKGCVQTARSAEGPEPHLE